MMNPTWYPAWMMPGTQFPVTIVKHRHWWQIWKPERWTEDAMAIVPPPQHPNCRTTLEKTHAT